MTAELCSALQVPYTMHLAVAVFPFFYLKKHIFAGFISPLIGGIFLET